MQTNLTDCQITENQLSSSYRNADYMSLNLFLSFSNHRDHQENLSVIHFWHTLDSKLFDLSVSVNGSALHTACIYIRSCRMGIFYNSALHHISVRKPSRVRRRVKNMQLIIRLAITIKKKNCCWIMPVMKSLIEKHGARKGSQMPLNSIN